MKEKKYIYFILISLLLSFVLIFFLILPKYQNIGLLKKEISENKIKIRSQKEYFQHLQQTAQDLQKYKEPLSKINSSLPESPMVPELLNLIQDACSQTNLILKDTSLSSITFKEIKGGSGKRIKETRVSLILNGEYQSFKKFISILENSARLIEIEKIYFSSPEKGNIFEFDIDVKIYSY